MALVLPPARNLASDPAAEEEAVLQPQRPAVVKPPPQGRRKGWIPRSQWTLLLSLEAYIASDSQVCRNCLQTEPALLLSAGRLWGR
eukprot:6204934-Pleurochrysis_carterae.AAC.1